MLIVAFKWALLGKVQPAMHPLWSSWASRWGLVCLAWNVCAGSRVAPHSVVMKHEHLRPGVLYAGFPTRPATDPTIW